MTPDNELKLRRLGEVELFRGCSDRELSEIAEVCEMRDLDAGTVLCRQGYPARDCVVVITGTASVDVNGEPVGTVGPGEAVGEMALLTRNPRSATVIASTPMSVYLINGARFDEVLRRTPDIPIAMLRRAASRLQHVYLMAGRPEAA